MLVYLGGPIDLVSQKESRQWRDEFAQELRAREMSAFNPAAAFSYVADKDTSRQLIEINKRAMFNCDVALFVMDKQTPSVGTPIELYMASQNGMRTIVVFTGGSQIPAYIHGFAQDIVHSTKEALDLLSKIRDSKATQSNLYMGGTIDTSKLANVVMPAINKARI